MATYSSHTEHAVQRVFTVPTPTNATEMAKAFAAADAELDRLYERTHPGKTRMRYDNDMTIEADEKNIRIIIGGRWMTSHDNSQPITNGW